MRNYQVYQSKDYAKNESMATKQKALSSMQFNGSNTSRLAKSDTKTKVVDLVLHNLPKDIDAIKLKQISGVRHVIGTDIKGDHLTGKCLGGRIQFRIAEGESIDRVKRNFLRYGMGAEEKQNDTRKKKIVDREPKGLRTQTANPVRWK